MKVWIDRDRCALGPGRCPSCFNETADKARPDVPCIVAFRDDGSATLTIYLLSDGHDEMLIIPPGGDRRELGLS